MEITKEQIEEYLKRFKGTEPLVVYPRDPYPWKSSPKFIESDIELRGGLYSLPNINPNRQYKIIAGFEKAKSEDFANYDWLFSKGGGLPDLFNKRVVYKMQEICPDDFNVLPVTLINLSDKVEPYENKDFYVVNALNTLNAIDKERSVIDIYPSGWEKVEKRIYKNNPWQGHSLAFDNSIKDIIYHPKLAKALYPSKQFQFMTPEENSYWVCSDWPERYDKETWFNWLRIQNILAYPPAKIKKMIDSMS